MGLITIKNENGRQLVSARDLHEVLESKERFSKWFNKMIDFGFEEGVDYTPYQMVHPKNNQEITDYVLKIDVAKEIAMVSKLPKGKIVRKYFIECEKQLQQIGERERFLIGLFSNDPAVVASSHKGLLELETRPLVEKLEIQAPKVEAFDAFMDNDGLYSYTNGAKLLGLKPRKDVIPFLKKRGIILIDNLGSQSGIERGLVKNVITKGGVYQQGKLTPKGIEYLRKNCK